MYICLCKGITEEMVESLASKGMPDKQVLKALGVGSDCGTCIIDALNKINNRENHKSAPACSNLVKQTK